jgi:hypothetical protein
MTVVQQAIKRSVIRGTKDMPRCSYGSKAHRCPKKGTWLVGYTSGLTGQRHVINRCTDHAWTDAALPAQAKNVMCVQRSTLN